MTFCILDYGILSDSLCMKGAIFAKIKIYDFYLCLFTTHLQASYFDCGNYYWKLSINDGVIFSFFFLFISSFLKSLDIE